MLGALVQPSTPRGLDPEQVLGTPRQHAAGSRRCCSPCRTPMDGDPNPTG